MLCSLEIWHYFHMKSQIWCLHYAAVDQKRPTNALVRNPACSFSHPLPPTHIEFIPDKAGTRPDLLATSGDRLRIWRISNQGSTLERLLENGDGVPKAIEGTNAITCFDWNELDDRRIASGATDSTVTIWDVETGAPESQMVAHDGEVNDIAWGAVDIFASVSSDCSVRVFDLRDKDHSTILYENVEKKEPLLKMSWNKQDPSYMAILGLNSSKVSIIDIRFPNLPIVELVGHKSVVNAISWAPHSAAFICSAGDDYQALIWDLSRLAESSRGRVDIQAEPILAYNAGVEVQQLQWSSPNPEWIAICCGNKTQVLRV